MTRFGEVHTYICTLEKWYTHDAERLNAETETRTETGMCTTYYSSGLHVHGYSLNNHNSVLLVV